MSGVVIRIDGFPPASGTWSVRPTDHQCVRSWRYFRCCSGCCRVHRRKPRGDWSRCRRPLCHYSCLHLIGRSYSPAPCAGLRIRWIRAAGNRLRRYHRLWCCAGQSRRVVRPCPWVRHAYPGVAALLRSPRAAGSRAARIRSVCRTPFRRRRGARTRRTQIPADWRLSTPNSACHTLWTPPPDHPFSLCRSDCRHTPVSRADHPCWTSGFTVSDSFSELSCKSDSCLEK